MVIKKIIVKNFKSLDNITVDKLTNVNMVFGHNNSGKSNFLKFIQLLFKRKVSESGKVVAQESGYGEQAEQMAFSTPGNWWEGIIENEPYIFQNGKSHVDIEFNCWVDISIREIKEIENFYDELKEAYFNDKLVEEFEIKSGEAKVETQKKKDELGKNPSGKDLENLKELTKKEQILRKMTESISRANGSKDDDFVEIEFKGRIKSLGNFDSNMSLDFVGIYGETVYDGTDTYFPKGSKNGSLVTNGYQNLQNLLGLLNDSVLFLDNDRYFSPEIEDKSIAEVRPKNFKNWLHNLSLDPFSKSIYDKVLAGIGGFNKTGLSGHLLKIEKNSPIAEKKLSPNYGRNQEKIQLLLSNPANPDIFLPIESFGTGIQQIIYILARIAEAEPKIILLEEVELNLSPTYQEKVLQHIALNIITTNPQKSTYQLFFTTHSPIMCYHSEYQIYESNIDENGITKFLKVDRDKIKEFYPGEVMKALTQGNN